MTVFEIVKIIMILRLRKVRNYLTSSTLILNNEQMPAETKVRLLKEELQEFDGR